MHCTLTNVRWETRFLILNFGFWIWDFWFRILALGFWISDFGFGILDFHWQISGVGTQCPWRVWEGRVEPREIGPFAKCLQKTFLVGTRCPRDEENCSFGFYPGWGGGWSPNLTDLYFWSLFICQQTNTKGIAGQSARGLADRYQDLLVDFTVFILIFVIFLHIQGVFLTGTPLKSSKYKKVNLGRSTPT